MEDRITARMNMTDIWNSTRNFFAYILPVYTAFSVNGTGT